MPSAMKRSTLKGSRRAGSGGSVGGISREEPMLLPCQRRGLVENQLMPSRPIAEDGVIDSALDDVCVARFAGNGEHAPVPHHVPDPRARLVVGGCVWKS